MTSLQINSYRRENSILIYSRINDVDINYLVYSIKNLVDLKILVNRLPFHPVKQKMILTFQF